MFALDESSKKFARVLFAAFPEWQQFQSAQEPEIFTRSVAGSLIVKVPSPVRVLSPEYGNWLLIDTCDGEVTITYDYFHTHFNVLEQSSETVPEAFGSIIDFLRAFTREEIFVAIGMRDKQWCGSAIVSAREPSTAGKFTQDVDRIYARSWRGNFDREVMLNFDG